MQCLQHVTTMFCNLKAKVRSKNAQFLRKISDLDTEEYQRNG